MSTEQRYSLSGATMGTRYSAVFYAAEAIDQSALQAELQQAVDRVDRQMSTWQADSDLMRLNAAPPGQWVELPEEPHALLGVGQQVAAGAAAAIGDGEAGEVHLLALEGFEEQVALFGGQVDEPTGQEAGLIEGGHGSSDRVEGALGSAIPDERTIWLCI